jgi:hypothetical protein
MMTIAASERNRPGPASVIVDPSSSYPWQSSVTESLVLPPVTRGAAPSMPRRSSSSSHTFEQKIAKAKSRFQKQASKLTAGPQLDELELKPGQLETAAHWNMMLSERPSKASK